MKRIAKMNGKEAVYDSVLSLAEKQKQERANTAPPSYLDLFRTKEMRMITILITILWMLISLEFDCTVRNITNLDFSIYVSFCISAALEFPADLLSIVGLEWLGRRWSAALSMLAVGNLCHGWKILCHLCHEHWISVLSRGATYHSEGPGYGSGPSDVHGQPSSIAPHRLL